MRQISTALLTLVLVLSSLATALGQSAPASPSATVPRLIHITGVFQPVDGQPPAGVEVVILSIYADPDGGLPVWQERQSVAVEKTTGRFALLLGASYLDGIPSEVFGAAQAQWMSLLFERLGEVEQPRVRIASVPYALKASDAETLGGLPASAYLRAPWTESTSGAAPTSSLEVSTDAPVMSNVVLPGTPNFLAKYANGADVGTSAVYETGGAVGVGTTTPFDSMHLRFTNTNGGATGLAVQNLGNTAASYSGMLFYDQNGVLGQFQGFNNVTHEYRINNIARNGANQYDGTINFLIGNSSKFLVAKSGDIGVGVPAPGFKLDVAGDINLTGTLKIGGATVLRATGNNTSVGLTALLQSSSGFNTGVGYGALIGTTGGNNTAVGYSALNNNVTGSNNIAVGFLAGTAPANTNSNNIEIGSFGALADSGTIRIGTPGTQTRFFAAGVRGVTTGQNDAVAVVVDSTGQLGTVSSSRRFKEDIRDMTASLTDRLLKLRPVTFRYTRPYADGSKPIQYGLVAEEVAEVFPELSVRNAAGEIETVHYEKLNVLLLKQLQEQQAALLQQQSKTAQQQRELEALKQQMKDLLESRQDAQ